MKKGFTLIELLAVIVILAIIAVIAIPIVIDLVNDAEKSSVLRSSEFYLEAVEHAVAKIQMNNVKINDGVYNVLENGNVCLKYNNNDSCTDELSVEVDGEKPNAGVMEFIKGEISYLRLVYNGKTILKDGTGKFKYTNVLENLAVASSALGVANVNDCASYGKECEPGIAFLIKVNDSNTYKFYVVSDDGKEATLIMDKNLGNPVSWYEKTADNSYGPLTALEYLNSQTSTWKNIDLIDNYTYVNNLNGTTKTHGYQKLEIVDGVAKLTSKDGNTINNVKGESRARFLTESEALDDLNCTSGNCPSWLYENLNSSKPKGYWLLTTSNDGLNLSRRAYYSGILVNSNVISSVDGIRPVITILK